MKRKNEDDATAGSSKGKKVLRNSKYQNNAQRDIVFVPYFFQQDNPDIPTLTTLFDDPTIASSATHTLNSQLDGNPFVDDPRLDDPPLDDPLLGSSSSTQPLISSDEKEETFVIKCSLKNTCRDTRFVSSIASVTAYTTKVMYIGALFMNYIALKILSKGEQVPIIDHKLVYSVFTLITGNGKKTSEYIQGYFKEFCKDCDINETMLETLKSIGYSSQNHQSQWPSSIEKNQDFEHIVQQLNTLWTEYQTMNCNPEDLYSQPHEFFKWLYYLQQKLKEKVYIMEETQTTVASKTYVYRKLKEIAFTSTLNRKTFKSLQEIVLQCINSKVPLVLGEKLKKLEAHLPALLKFVTNVQSRIEDGTFKPTKYTDQRGYRFFTILPTYTFETKAIQIDAQAFWRLVKQSGVGNYTTGAKDESDLSDFYYSLFDFS
ncbi:hypothetical protein MFLAVUS_000033 [Mucor flavus]|uniref:Uncharacterized protein n=1 Tax=Mucor flavus TaxID=439312 RepID=A0ABP9YIL6_9FUNG